MRHDRTVTFVREIAGGGYNEATGDFDEPEIMEYERNAHVSDTGTERMMILYGEIKSRAKTVRLRHRFEVPFDYVLIDGVQYHSPRGKQFRHKSVFEVVQQ